MDVYHMIHVLCHNWDIFMELSLKSKRKWQFKFMLVLFIVSNFFNFEKFRFTNQVDYSDWMYYNFKKAFSKLE